jgi:hypothetical protein
LERKAAWLDARLEGRGQKPRWHMIGHLQRNKVRRTVRLADTIHSIDSERLLEDVDRVAVEEGRTPELYLQVKLADEAAKSGLRPDAVVQLVERASLRAARLVGLMTIAPLVTEVKSSAGTDVLDVQLHAASETFDALAALAAELPTSAFVGERPQLSMGMSTDFEQAVAAGSDVVRVGSALFEDIDTAELRT